MQFINTHSHIYAKAFDTDRDEAITRAKQGGVSHILLPDIDSRNRTRLQNLVAQYPDICKPMVGIHPTSVNENYEYELAQFDAAIQNKTPYGIGEIGIDLYRDTSFLAQQRIVFLHQIQLAHKMDLPVAIHVRNSFPEVFDALAACNIAKFSGVFHCFSGTIHDAYKAIEMGFSLGIGGIVTYKNADLPTVVKEIGIQHLVLETDDPWLSPVPFRGKRNEPAYVQYVAQKIAEIKNCTVQEVAEQTSQNAIELFKL